jgi:hypothetical protein
MTYPFAPQTHVQMRNWWMTGATIDGYRNSRQSPSRRLPIHVNQDYVGPKHYADSSYSRENLTAHSVYLPAFSVRGLCCYNSVYHEVCYASSLTIFHELVDL